MTILIIYQGTIDPEKGGIQRVTHELADYFELKGLSVYYLSLRSQKDDSLHPTRQLLMPESFSFNSKPNIEYFKQVIADKKIDIIINQGAQGPQLNLLSKIAKNEGCKIISVHHNSPLSKVKNFNSTFANRIPKRMHWIFRYSQQKYIQKILLQIYKLKYQTHFKEICLLSDKFVLLSNKFISELGYFTNNKYLNNVIGIPNPTAYSQNNGITSNQKELIYVGRINSIQKRVDLLLQIWSKLHSDFPNWKLRIVGNGPELNEMKRLSKSLNLTNVFFEGKQPPNEYYKKASILCMTSAYEGFGIVLIEAMHYGVVPFAFNSYASASDIIDNEINGYLITPFDIDEYVSKLKALMTSETTWQTMSKEAIEKSKFFAIDKIGDKWINMINELHNQ